MLNRQPPTREEPQAVGLPRAAPVVTSFALFLAAMYAVIAVVDVFGHGAAFLASRGALSAWLQLFDEGSLVEWAQTAAMVGVLLAAPWVAAHARTHTEVREAAATFRLLWLLAVGVAVLLIEDSGNVGQRLQHVVRQLLAPSAEVVGAVRLPLFAIAGGILTWALWRYRRALRGRPTAARLLMGGWLAYAVMGVTGELLNYLFRFYRTAGGWLAEDLFRGRLEPPPGTPPLWDRYEVVFMDFVFEESLELMATAMLLGGVLALGRSVSNDISRRRTSS